MAAGSSNFDASTQIRDREFLYASNVNVSNFLSVKLSSERNYYLWTTQMLCLLKSRRMGGMVDDSLASPRASSTPEIWEEYRSQYESLVKGWIFGSVSEDVLGNIVDLTSAKHVWNKLKSIYDPDPAAMICQEEPNINRDVVSAEKDTHGKETGTKVTEEKETRKIKLRKATVKGDWVKAKSILEKDKDLAKEAISSDDSTVLHIAAGTGHSYLLKMLLVSFIDDEKTLVAKRSDGCTALHIAAIVGNKYAANLLVKKNKYLLQMEDNKGEKPFHKALENMHLDTITYLYEEDNKRTKRTAHSDAEKGSDSINEADLEKMFDVLHSAISANQYKLASRLVNLIPKAAWKYDNAPKKLLLAIAQNFPNGLDNLETIIYPRLGFTRELIYFATQALFVVLFSAPEYILRLFFESWSKNHTIIARLLWYAFLTVLGMYLWTIILIILVIVVVYFLLHVLYWLFWKGARILIAPIKHIDNKKKEMDYANNVLRFVCQKIDELKSYDEHHYEEPLLAASRQNAYKVVEKILSRSPKAIHVRDNSGYDIIQLAIINRSENIYNLIYDIGDHKNSYRKVKDSSNNNILHLAGRLAPSRELNKRRGAALQLQRELQWFEEIKKHLFPTHITQANRFGETPNMVFTREHENLVKEGEKWMITTAESCSITAALITTIVFAGAITVPGGNDEAGIPMFIKNSAFTVFAVSDAISLFASSTSLLVFLSILTARFSEDDFLVSLPRRLLIGLCSLLVSTIAMMAAFSATLFLVFCDKKLWLLAPVCVLAFIPILSFVTLQFPLIVDIFLTTYFPIFGERKSFQRKIKPDDMRLYIACEAEIIQE